MRLPPIKPDRCLLWITLRADGTVQARYAALRAVLKTCRLHPLDTTAAAELVIVEEAALRVRLAEVRATLAEGDTLHLITHSGGRLVVEVIEPPDAGADRLVLRPADQIPPWLV